VADGQETPVRRATYAAEGLGVASTVHTVPFQRSVVTFTARVIPNPGGGKLSFTDNGKAISGCQDLASSSGRATCKVTFAKLGTYEIAAGYSGDAAYVPSTSRVLTEKVT
jgi:hypothetical protein